MVPLCSGSSGKSLSIGFSSGREGKDHNTFCQILCILKGSLCVREQTVSEEKSAMIDNHIQMAFRR